MIVDAWDKRFAGYYGDLSDSASTISTTVFDPKNPLQLQQVTMDLIEFRLRSFHNLKGPNRTLRSRISRKPIPAHE